MSGNDIIKLIVESIFVNDGFNKITTRLTDALSNEILEQVSDIEIFDFADSWFDGEEISFTFDINNNEKSLHWNESKLPFAWCNIDLSDGSFDMNCEQDYN